MTLANEQFERRLPHETARQLYGQISELEVIDTHEHLYSEAYRVSQVPDAVLMCQQQYTALHLMAGGMPPDQMTARRELAYNLPLWLPMVDVHTIGAGGGSIAAVDAMRLIKVGPSSAGSWPGPVA